MAQRRPMNGNGNVNGNQNGHVSMAGNPNIDLDGSISNNNNDSSQSKDRQSIYCGPCDKNIGPQYFGRHYAKYHTPPQVGFWQSWFGQSAPCFSNYYMGPFQVIMINICMLIVLVSIIVLVFPSIYMLYLTVCSMETTRTILFWLKQTVGSSSHKIQEAQKKLYEFVLQIKGSRTAYCMIHGGIEGAPSISGAELDQGRLDYGPNSDRDAAERVILKICKGFLLEVDSFLRGFKMTPEEDFAKDIVRDLKKTISLQWDT